MLLWAPAVSAPSVPPLPALFARSGLNPDDAQGLSFGGRTMQWADGADAAPLFAEATRAPCRTIGPASSPPAEGGWRLALRCRDDRRDIEGILRLSALAGMIASPIDGCLIGWLPARLWSPAGLFCDAVEAVERQGLPPVMHLIGFDCRAGDEILVSSDGLAWFCDQELRLTAPSACGARQALRHAARLAVDAMVHGGIDGPMTVAGISDGEVLVIDAPRDGIVHAALRPAGD